MLSAKLQEKFHMHRKPDIRIPFIPEENYLISGLFLYAIHRVDKLHDLVLGKIILISGLFLNPVFLYPVSSVHPWEYLICDSGKAT